MNAPVQFVSTEAQEPHYKTLYTKLKKQGYPNVDYYLLMLIGAGIATLGLLLNSADVIIGAMIISPLMKPIISIAFGNFMRDYTLMLRSTGTLLSGLALAIGISYLLGHWFSSMGTTHEIMSRTEPNILNMLIALSAGFLGAYSHVKKSLTSTVAGVAHAIALLPPLCVVGIGLAYGNPAIYFGAMLLFVTNLVSIVFSGLLAFILLEIPHHRPSFHSLALPLVTLVALSFPLFSSFGTLMAEKELNRSLTLALHKPLLKQVEVLRTDVDLFRQPIQVTLTVRATSDQMTPNRVQQIKRQLEISLRKPVSLILNVIPMEQIRVSE
jgi:uncharacterized hydrophobic protein (TIGR00271 family)